MTDIGRYVHIHIIYYTSTTWLHRTISCLTLRYSAVVVRITCSPQQTHSPLQCAAKTIGSTCYPGISSPAVWPHYPAWTIPGSIQRLSTEWKCTRYFIANVPVKEGNMPGASVVQLSHNLNVVSLALTDGTFFNVMKTEQIFFNSGCHVSSQPMNRCYPKRSKSLPSSVL